MSIVVQSTWIWIISDPLSGCNTKVYFHQTYVMQHLPKDLLIFNYANMIRTLAEIGATFWVDLC